jgi:hypothetical protein
MSWLKYNNDPCDCGPHGIKCNDNLGWGMSFPGLVFSLIARLQYLQLYVFNCNCVS